MIDDRLLAAYVAEIEALGTHGAEFAREYPDIASELDIGSRRSRDGSVERVVESTAFLAARLRLLIESNSAELPVTVLSMLAPVLIEPVPSMAVAGLEGGTEPRTLPHGARLDYRSGSDPLYCFATTMDTVLAPLRLTVRRSAPAARALDALSVRLDGEIPSRLYLYLGRNRLSASILLDAIGKSLVGIELRRPTASGASSVAISPSSLRFHGFSSADRALPDRPGAPRPFRLFTEFVNFEEKFRFVSIKLPETPSGSELVFRFERRLTLRDEELDGTFSVNRVPVVNLWPATGTPFDLTGRSLEYPVRVDARRYRVVETHSVERVDLFHASGGSALNVDPLVAASRRSESPIQWGIKRALSRSGAEVYLYFRGLDYQQLGRERMLVSPRVLASNGALAQGARSGTELFPTESISDWRARLLTVPTPYRPALADTAAMRTLASYIQSSLRGLAVNDGQRSLRDYLRRFPGAHDASWIEAIRRLSLRGMVAMRDGRPTVGTRAFIGFDASHSPTSSFVTIERVLQRLFDAHRGLNSVEEVVLHAS